MGTGKGSYDIKWSQDEVSIRWIWYRIEMEWVQESGYEMEWVQD